VAAEEEALMVDEGLAEDEDVVEVVTSKLLLRQLLQVFHSKFRISLERDVSTTAMIKDLEILRHGRLTRYRLDGANASSPRIIRGRDQVLKTILQDFNKSNEPLNPDKLDHSSRDFDAVLADIRAWIETLEQDRIGEGFSASGALVGGFDDEL